MDWNGTETGHTLERQACWSMPSTNAEVQRFWWTLECYCEQCQCDLIYYNLFIDLFNREGAKDLFSQGANNLNADIKFLDSLVDPSDAGKHEAAMNQPNESNESLPLWQPNHEELRRRSGRFWCGSNSCWSWGERCWIYSFRWAFWVSWVFNMCLICM